MLHLDLNTIRKIENRQALLCMFAEHQTHGVRTVP